MSFFTDRTIVVLLAIIVIGGGFLYWYHDIDGVKMNRPIVYMVGTDPLNLELERRSYKPGEMVRFYTAFCKTREALAATQWVLIDGEQRFYPVKPPHGVPVGCYPIDVKTGKKTLSDIETIFLDVKPGCDYYFVATVVRTISGGRILPAENLRTQSFCVTKR